jgi:SAM-dependent methyltransferase
MAVTTQYDALASVYEFLVPEALLEPAGSLAAFAPWLGGLDPGAPVLDCACGPGHLAVGLAQAGFAVTATDANRAMVRQASELAKRHGVELTAEPLRWDELDERRLDERFAAVFCVGNSLAHAEASRGRRRALGAMARVLCPEGRLLLTARNWEAVKAAGSRLTVGDRVVVRGARRGVVIYGWSLPDDWEARHRLDIAVALLDVSGAVEAVAEELDFWPFRREQLLDELSSVGLRVEATTYEDTAESYLVVARRSD